MSWTSRIPEWAVVGTAGAALIRVQDNSTRMPAIDARTRDSVSIP